MASALIQGKDRCKYLQQPILSSHAYDIGELGILTLPVKFPTIPNYQEEFQSKAIQTMFRDEETQTEPWNPSYYIYPGTNDPDMLNIKNFKYGIDLPAGVLELDMIDRIYKRKFQEEKLLILEKQDRKLALEKRFKLINEQEQEEWTIREKEIELLQQNHMEKFEKALNDEYRNLQEKKHHCLINTWIEKETAKNEIIQKLQRNTCRDICKLEYRQKFHKNALKIKKRDIIADYSDYSSPMYAPLAHMGRKLAISNNKPSPSIYSPYLTTMEGMKEFETWLDDRGIKLVEIKLPEEKKTATHIRFEKQILQELYDELRNPHFAKQFYENLLNKEEYQRKSNECYLKPSRNLLSPPACLRNHGIQEESKSSKDQSPILLDTIDKNYAFVIMQKILRGRSVQKKMLLEKERYKDLIQELCSMQAISIEEKDVIYEKLELKHKLNKDKYCQNTKKLVMNEIIDEWEGNVISNGLGILSREYQYLQQEELISFIALHAKLNRELREAEEMWRRHQEMQFREMKDKIVKEIQLVQKEVMEKYRNYILADTITILADNETRIELKLMANIAYLEHIKSIRNCLNDSLALGVNDAALKILGNIKEFAENVTNIHNEITANCMNLIFSKDFISELVDCKVRIEMIELQERKFPNDNRETDFLLQVKQDLCEMKTEGQRDLSFLNEDQTISTFEKAVVTTSSVKQTVLQEEEEIISTFNLNDNDIPTNVLGKGMREKSYQTTEEK